MKKKLVAIASFILALIMSVSTIGGCKLITTDEEKDMQQVVATVSIQKGVSDKVIKQDLIMDYLNYGYYYVQYQGYTMQKAIELIVDSRVNTLILLQNAKKELNADSSYEKNTQITNVWDSARYLSETDEVNAKYNVYKAINDLLDQFEKEKDPTKVTDTYSETARTTPTNAANDEEVSDDAKKIYVDEIDANGFDTTSTSKRREAFNKFINYLKINNVLGGKYDGKDIKTTVYFKDSVVAERNNLVVENYRKHLRKQERVKYTYQDLKDAYENKYNEQTEWTNAEFADALSNATVGSPVLFNANGNYGYVYNLLLGIDDIQSERIKAIDATQSIKDKEIERMNILATTRVKDLRTSWISSGYDLEGTFTDNVSTDVKFTGDYTFTETNSLPFQGEVVRLKEKTDDQDAEYRATASYMGLDDFIDAMDSYLSKNSFDVNYDASQDANAVDISSSFSGNSIYGAKQFTAVDDYEEKINEMLFAFSTDDGSLNTYKGYVVKPIPDGANTEEYVKTFATAGRELLSLGAKNSYVIVASDYGYHVMFYSQVYNKDQQNYATLDQFLDANLDKGTLSSWNEYYVKMLDTWDDWEDTDNYLYSLLDSLSTNKITNQLNRIERNLANEYRYKKSGAVVIKTEVYADLYE